MREKEAVLGSQLWLGLVELKILQGTTLEPVEDAATTTIVDIVLVAEAEGCRLRTQ